MDNREGTFIGIGAMAIACLCYFYQQFKEERLEYKAKKKTIEERCRASLPTGPDYRALQVSGQKELHLFPAVTDYTAGAAFSAFVRARKNHLIAPRAMEALREDQSGGQFEFRDGERRVGVEIKNCHIEEEALQERREKCIVFLDENRHKKAESSSLAYSLRAGQRLALFGAVGYSLSEQRFVVEPEFIVVARGDAEGVAARLAEFWQEKIYRATFWKLLLAFSIAAVGYGLVYRPVRALLRRRQEKFGEVSKAKLSHFGGQAQFSARLDGHLLCELCRNANVNVIYECGHLCICEACHDGNLAQRCPLCNKTSAQAIKIFL